MADATTPQDPRLPSTAQARPSAAPPGPGALPRPGARRGPDTHAPLASDPRAAIGVEAFLAGLAAVDPTVLVRRAVRSGRIDAWLGDLRRPKPIAVVALGKAAPRMLWGLVEASVPFHGIGVAPRGVPAPGVDTFRWLPGDHPVPGPASFAAGQAVLEWADALPAGTPVLALLSGGASACVEAPAEGWSMEEVARLHDDALRDGQPIEQVNARRSPASALKAGGLGRRILARTQPLEAWLLVDTDPAHPEAVGSGPFWMGDSCGSHVAHLALASSNDLAAAAGLRLGAMGREPYRHGERVAGPIEAAVEAFVRAAATLPAGASLVGAGEPALMVPQGSPAGGRCHHAALLASGAMARAGIEGVFLALASDGVDGSSGATGAWTRPQDWDASAARAASRLEAAPWLAQRGRTVDTGRTGTNVNDLWLLLRA